MFSRLPVELNEDILSYIGSNDKRTLGAICRTNKLGNRLAIPLFYSTVGVTYTHYESELSRLARLCETLVNDPSLCTHVKYLELKLDNARGPRLFEEYIYFDTDQCQYSLDQVPDHIADPIVAVFRNALNRQPPRIAFGTLLLVLCRHATELYICGNGNVDDMFLLKCTLEDMGRLGPYFAYKSVTVAYEGESAEGPCQADILPLIRLPLVRSLSLNAFEPSRTFFTLTPLPSQQTLLQELKIVNCDADGRELAPLLAFCPHLRSLHIEWTHRPSNFWRTDWRMIGDALRGLSKLEVLRLEHPYDSTISVDARQAAGIVPAGFEGQTITPLGTLSGSKNLHTVAISSMALFGSDGFNPGVSIHSDDQVGDAQGPLLGALLPASLRDLTVFYHDIYLAGNIRLLPRDPVARDLQGFTLYNCQKEQWISRDGIEGYSPIVTKQSVNVHLNQILNGPPNLEAAIMASLSQIPTSMQLAALDSWYQQAGQDLPLVHCNIVRAALDQVRNDIAL